MFILYVSISLCAILPHLHGYNQLDSLAHSLLEEVVSRMGDHNILSDDYDTNPLNDYDLNFNHDIRDSELHLQPRIPNAPVTKGHGNHFSRTRHDLLLGREPSTRDQEYLQHSSLLGHQYMQGGAGEGFQRLRPDGSMKNKQIIKTDSILPAYCDPPNPCPLGYSSEDGCLEDFVNTAEFSRKYQEAEDCMCDPDHMFECPESVNEDRIDALAGIFANNVMDTVANRLPENIQIEDQHKNLVAKKFFLGKHEDHNPYLHGEKLRVVAKKSPREKQSLLE